MPCLPENVIFYPDGIHSCDGCAYIDKVYRNATVVISECENCGHVTIGWMRQPNTVEVESIEDAVEENARESANE